MKKALHKTSLHISGWLLIVFGFLGLVLPIIPGIPFFILGIYILSLGWLWLYIKIEKVKIRYPSFGIHYDKIDAKISKYIKKAH